MVDRGDRGVLQSLQFLNEIEKTSFLFLSLHDPFSVKLAAFSGLDESAEVPALSRQKLRLRRTGEQRIFGFDYSGPGTTENVLAMMAQVYDENWS